MRGEFFQNVINSIADAGRDILRGRTADPQDATIAAKSRDLLSEKGEALGTALACDVLEHYRSLSNAEKLDFFLMLRDQFEPDQAILDQAIATYQADPSRENRLLLERAVESPRQALIRAMNMAPGGTPTLLKMREDLQNFLKSDKSLKIVDADFVHLFSSWFNRGFLRLQEISWETPAAILEKIIEYEAVHAIADWSDLRRRLAEDRRCYGFFHPALPGEPLIFVEVALTQSLSDAVQPLLSQDHFEKPELANTAIFYSISNCQSGLKGISFGNFLIKQVVMELKAELPNISRFSTLSPIPAFRKWVEEDLEQNLSGENDNPADDLFLNDPDFMAAYQQFQQSQVQSQQDLSRLDQDFMTRLCAYYLAKIKKRDMPFDPVARFHLGNGARLERLNWLGDCSENGLRQSYGMMVNYLYDLESIEKNHEAYINHNEVCLSPEVSSQVIW